MPFLEHLAVLRKHLIRSSLWFAAAAAVAFFFVDRAWDYLMLPLCEIRPSRCFVYPRDLTEAFWVYLKVGALIAFFLSSPLLMVEAWAFIAPGLYQHEKKVAVPFGLAAGALFAAGAAFGFFAIFPVTFRFLFGLEEQGQFLFLTSMRAYFKLCSTLLLAFGVMFELPLLMMLLSMGGVLRPRFFVRYRRLMYFGMLVFSAVVTPTTDPVTMLMMGGPMIVLYEIGLVLARIFERTRQGPESPPAGA